MSNQYVRDILKLTAALEQRDREPAYTDDYGYTYQAETEDGDFTGLRVTLPDGYSVTLTRASLAAFAEVQSSDPR